MKITYRNTNYESLDDCRLLASWYADPEIRHLAVPLKDENSLKNPETAEEIQTSKKNACAFKPIVDLMILRDQQPIGHCTILSDPPHRLTREGKVAWLGITIGDPDSRRRGIGKAAMLYLEELAVSFGASCAEVGVFEFNEPSLRMCLSLGYERVGRKEQFTYWDGKHWADLRLLKKLGS